MSEAKPVVVYSSPGRSSCQALKGFLSAKGIAFTNHDVMDDPAALEEVVRRTGARAVPVVVVGEEFVVGFDRGKLQRLLEIS